MTFSPENQPNRRAEDSSACTPSGVAGHKTGVGHLGDAADPGELLTALALRHLRLVPETPYGAELANRIEAEVKALVFKEKP